MIIKKIKNSDLGQNFHLCEIFDTVRLPSPLYRRKCTL